jgi:hypothetical protein
MEISYIYSNALRRQRNFHHIGIAAACIIMLVGLAFIAAGVVRLELLELAHRELFLRVMALGIALVALGALSIASYAAVRAVEWASRRSD